MRGRRLNEKSGLFQNLGENQVKEVIHASNLSVFFLDEDQRVTLKDRIEVRADLLDETDGPTLVHRIQALHGQKVAVPRRMEDRPSEERLVRRYEAFLVEGRKVS